MLYQYLERFLDIPAPVIGSIFVDQEETASRAYLYPQGIFAVAPLNPPLPEHLEFRGWEVFAVEVGTRQKVPEEMIYSGLHVFLLLDPRTYLSVDNLLQGDIQENQRGVHAYVTFPVEEVFSQFDIGRDVIGWLSSVLGSTYPSSFFFSGRSVQIAIQDPIPEMGLITVRFE